MVRWEWPWVRGVSGSNDQRWPFCSTPWTGRHFQIHAVGRRKDIAGYRLAIRGWTYKAHLDTGKDVPSSAQLERINLDLPRLWYLEERLKLQNPWALIAAR